MTYCVGLKIDRGLVFMSDTRTSGGIDNISTFKKMHVWEKPGERVVVLMSAGNLATTQAVMSLLEGRSKAAGDVVRRPRNPVHVPDGALIGETVKEVILTSSPSGQKADSYFNGLSSSAARSRARCRVLPHLSGRQLHRIDGRHAVLSGR